MHCFRCGDPRRRGAWAHPPPSRDPALDKKGHSPLTLLLNRISSRVRCVSTSVLTGRARLPGFRVGFRAQNPSLPLLRPSGFALFQALGFFKLFQSFSIFFCSFENTLHLTSYKITHIEANSTNIGMRNDVPTCFSIKKEHNINFQHSM